MIEVTAVLEGKSIDFVFTLFQMPLTLLGTAEILGINECKNLIYKK